MDEGTKSECLYGRRRRGTQVRLRQGHCRSCSQKPVFRASLDGGNVQHTKLKGVHAQPMARPKMRRLWATCPRPKHVSTCGRCSPKAPTAITSATLRTAAASAAKASIRRRAAAVSAARPQRASQAETTRQDKTRQIKTRQNRTTQERTEIQALTHNTHAQMRTQRHRHKHNHRLRTPELMLSASTRKPVTKHTLFELGSEASCFDERGWRRR